MASSLALKRLVSSTLLSRSLRPFSALSQPSSYRLFNTNAVRESDSADRDVDIGPRLGRFSIQPCDEITMSQIRDRFKGSSVTKDSSVPVTSGWDAETDDGLHLRLYMPGLGKEDVKVSVEQNTLIIRIKIKGEGKKESEESEGGKRYTSSIYIPEKLYDTINVSKMDAADGKLHNKINVSSIDAVISKFMMGGREVQDEGGREE